MENTKKMVSDLSGVKIAVDLTPMLPGGENGGAKLMTVELVNTLARLLPATDFVIFTAEASHSELDWLEKEHSNIQRMCVLLNSPVSPSNSTAPPVTSWKEKAFYRLKALASDLLPKKLKQRITAMPSAISALRKRVFNQLKATPPFKLKYHLRRLIKLLKPATGQQSLVQQIGAHLLFCPFTAPFYADPLIPTVSVIYDLQYRAYPQFFTTEEVIERGNNFRIACQKASHLVAISEFVRHTVINTVNFPPERVTAVPIGLLHTAKHSSEEETLDDERLGNYGLYRGHYIHYPANFWQHKNHSMLLTAFNLYQRANPDSTLKLLCTGAPGRRSEIFCEEVRRMRLTDWVIYPGYVTADDYSLLLRSAFAMIFPSLYEGFGIPVLEAMSAGVPVLCSNVTSLPEVGGDAVLYFDPRQPNQIVDALTRLSQEPHLREGLITKGKQRTALFAGIDRMAYDYIDVFLKALPRKMNSSLAKSI